VDKEEQLHKLRAAELVESMAPSRPPQFDLFRAEQVNPLGRTGKGKRARALSPFAVAKLDKINMHLDGRMVRVVG
jgi:hypothetical protein